MNDIVVKITGTPRVGYTLTATVDPEIDGSFEWFMDGQEVGTGPTYLVQPEDAGKKVRAKFFFDGEDDDDGKRKKSPSLRILPVESNDPRGDFELDDDDLEQGILSIDTHDSDWADVLDRDGFAASDKSYQWYRNGVAIEGATADSYSVQSEDEGAEITLRIDYVDGLGAAKYVVSQPEKLK